MTKKPAATLAVDRFPKLSAIRLRPISVALAGAGSLAALPATVGAAPTLNPDFYTVAANHSLSGVNVLTNDINVNGFYVCHFTQPSIGLANVASNGNLFFTPHSGLSGHDQFTYSVCPNGSTLSNASANVNITVTPVAVDDILTTPQAHSLVGNVLTNDIGSALHVVGFGSPAHGVLVGGIASNGSFTYQPSISFTGGDSFGYVIQDGFGSNAAATVNINVVPVGFFLVAGTNQHAPVNTQFPQPLTVSVLLGSAGVPGTDVCFTPVSNSAASAILSSPSAITDSNGNASVIATANSNPGAYLVDANLCFLGSPSPESKGVGGVTPKAAGDATLVFELRNDPPAGTRAIPALSGTLLALLSALVGWFGWRRRI